MTTQANYRDIRYIPPPKSEQDFEHMCVHIYEERYHSSRLFGRDGQPQQGVDIILNDYRSVLDNKHGGRVFVQCKFTTTKLNYNKIKLDVLAAKEKVENEIYYKGVYFFILATNAANDKALHDMLQKLQVQEDLPFTIELHSWDKLCSLIQISNRLWYLYNHQPGAGLDPGLRFPVDQLTKGLLRRIRAQDLEGAQKLVQKHLNQHRLPGHESYQLDVPHESWKHSVELRSALLELYRQASDSRGALPILQHEYGISDMEDVDCLLAYVRADRVTGNLRSSDYLFSSSYARPRFGESLQELASRIFSMQGSPDKIGCLALVLIMESNQVDIQDKALEMMSALKERDAGTVWEPLAHVAYAIVRLFYVRRRGWAPASRYYTLGDLIPGSQYYLGPNSPLLGAPFESHGVQPIKIAGRNPFASPEDCNGDDYLVRWFTRLLKNDCQKSALPELEAECQVYSFNNYRFISGMWNEPSSSWSDRRVVGFPTLAIIAKGDNYRNFLARHELLITEKTFVRLLGYRAFLKICAERSDAPGEYCEKNLEAIEWFTEACRYRSSIRESGKGSITVMPVYDSPPPRLINLADPIGPFNDVRAFTLTRDRLYHRRDWMRLSMSPEKISKLEGRYLNRGDDFSLSCLLALHQHVSMLTFDSLEHILASQMGIAAQHPFQQSLTT